MNATATPNLHTPQAGTICGRCGGNLPPPPGKPRPKPDRLGAELHRMATLLLSAAERVDHLADDDRLHARHGAELALRLGRLNLAVFRAIGDAEKAAEESEQECAYQLATKEVGHAH
jgi:hypothetical protein